MKIIVSYQIRYIHGHCFHKFVSVAPPHLNKAGRGLCKYLLSKYFWYQLLSRIAYKRPRLHYSFLVHRKQTASYSRPPVARTDELRLTTRATSDDSTRDFSRSEARPKISEGGYDTIHRQREVMIPAAVIRIDGGRRRTWSKMPLEPRRKMSLYDKWSVPVLLHLSGEQLKPRGDRTRADNGSLFVTHDPSDPLD